MFFLLFLVASTLFLPLFVDALTLFAPTFVLSFVTLFPLLASPFLFGLSFLFASLLLFSLSASAFLFLCSLLSLNLALLLQLLLSDSLPFLAPGFCLVGPSLVGFASALLFLGSCFSPNLLDPVFAHLGKTLVLDELVEQRADSVHNVGVYVGALAGAFDDGGGHAGVFG